MTENTPEDDGDVTVKIDLYPEDAPEKAIRQIGLGIQPFILLEVEADGDDVVFKVIGSLLDDVGELVEMLEGFTDTVKAAVEQQRATEEQAVVAGG